MPDPPTSNPEPFYQGAPLLLIRQGAAIAVRLRTRPYGLRDFSIRDPNGVMLVLGQDWD